MGLIRVILLCLLCAGCVAEPPYTTRFTDRFLRSSTDAASARAIIGADYFSSGKTVYLSARTDGEAGAGTIVDPYDASTAVKLHALWSSLTNTTVVFLPGDYYMTTFLSCGGKKIYGYGATLYASNNVRIAWIRQPELIEGLTLDMGTYITSSTINTIAVSLTNDSVARNVTIKKLQGDVSVNEEGFGFTCSYNNALIEGCKIIDAEIWKHTYVSAISIGAGYGHRVINNFISLDPGNSPTNDCYGISTYADDTLVVGNYVKNVANAVHHDGSGSTPPDGYWNDNLYVGNYLQGNMRTIRFDSTAQYYKDWDFRDNIIESSHTGAHYNGAVANWNCDTWVYLAGTATHSISNFTFSGNTFKGGVKDTGGKNIITSVQPRAVGIHFIGNRWAPTAALSDPTAYKLFDYCWLSNGTMYAVGPTYTNSI